MDVLHGVHIPMTNMSTMIVPGYVAEITTTFPKPANILCYVMNIAAWVITTCGAIFLSSPKKTGLLR